MTEGYLHIETPENVELSLELAGPGSRFCAMLIDSLLIWLVIFCLAIAVMCLGVSTETLVEREGPSAWAVALLVLVVTAVLFGYHAFFELVLHGQTPGKRSMKLRVIHEDGTPAAALDLVIRNVVRIVDFLPAFYVVGGAACLLSATNKRLGDMAAGTVVIKEAEISYASSADKKAAVPLPAVAIANAALAPEEQQLIRGFLQRRVELMPAARAGLAERLALQLHEKHGGVLGDPESYLERLSEGRQFES
jgi:uncharacterized RDD family membrane protein YckC